MSRVEQHKQARAALVGHLSELVRVCTAQQQTFSQLNTEAYQPGSMLAAISKRGQSIEKARWAEIPTQELEAIEKVTSELIGKIRNLGDTLESDRVARKGVSDFRIIDSLNQSRDEHLEAFEDAYYKFASSTRDLSSPSDEVLQSMQNAYDRTMEIERQIAKQKDNVDSSVKAIKNSSLAIASDKHATAFRRKADELEKEFRSWLWGAIICAVATVVTAFFIMRFLSGVGEAEAPADPVVRAMLFISKFAVLGFLASAATYAARTAKSIKHNALGFSLRSRALETMQLVIESTEDPQTRAGIIQQVTMCIFSHQPTGLIGSETDTSMTPQMIELIRSVSSPPGKA